MRTAVIRFRSCLLDEAGNAMTEAELTPFTVTLDGPAVVSLTVNGAPPSAYASALTEARAQFADRGGVGLDFTDGGSSLAVTGPNGPVDGFIQEEGSGLVWRPTGIIDADGSYTVSASAVDKRGRTSATLSHMFILDTQAPSVVSSSLAFDEELTSPLNSVQLTLSDGEGVGVDLSASQIALSGPNGSIPLQKSFDGSVLTLVFPEINENGGYTLSVLLADEAGNAMTEAELTPFTVTLDGPAVVSLTVNGAPPSAYASALTEARAQFAGQRRRRFGLHRRRQQPHCHRSQRAGGRLYSRGRFWTRLASDRHYRRGRFLHRIRLGGGQAGAHKRDSFSYVYFGHAGSVGCVFVSCV